MSKTPQEAISASQNDDTERRSDQRFASGYGGGKLVSRLTMQDLKLVQDAFTINQTGQERELSLDRNQFCEVMSIVLSKGTEEEYGDLFDKIDVTKEGFVDWDKFCSHMLLEYYEKDDRMKTTQVPQWRELKTLQSPHKDIIKRLSPLNNPSRYISISKEGVVCMWSLNMKLLRTVQIHTDQDEVKQRDLWVTDFVPMQNLYKFALALTSKEIAIYDLSSKSEFNCQFRVQGLQFTPLCMDYWNNPKNPNEAILVYGDVSGQVNALLFSAATIALFDRPSQHTSDTQDVYLNVDIQDVARGKYRNARIVQHHGHSEWTRQVAYSAHLDCFISCATTYKNALVLGWIEKAKMNMRITQFKVPQGVLAFDYNEKLNLIATAGVNHHVCLWNPYVVSKPVGVLRGHMQSVVAVQFIQNRGQLISLSKDKVLRIWDTHLQVCQQRLSGMFPKGPVEVSITMFYDEEHCKLFTAFNHQLTLMMMKAEVKDRIISHEQPVTAAIYNKKFNQVVSACSGSVITMWMVDTGQKVKQFANAHGNSEITALTQDTSETRLFTGSADGTVKIWDFNGHCHHILMAGNGSPAEISQVLCLKRIILAVGWDRTLCVFRDGQINSFYVYPSEWKGRQEHQDDIISAAFCSPTTLATAGYDGDIVIWNLNSEQASRHLVSHSYIKSAGRTSRAKSRSRSRADTSSSPAKGQEDTKLSVPGTGSNLSIDSAQSEPNSTSDQGDGGNAVTNLIFLTERPQSASNNGANLVCCNANGWVRFWNTQGSTIVGEFLAHEHAASLTMAVDDKNQVLVTGDADGSVRVWDMTEFSRRRNTENQAPPPLLKHFQPHTDVINSIELLTRNDRLLILTASSDCSVALWDTKGRQVGVFGQEEHWKIDLIAEEEKEVKESSEEESEVKVSEEKEKLSDEEKNQLIEVSTDESYDPNFRVKTWGNTILGKAYRESRGEKRERRQPQTIPNLPYLVWEKTGQTPAGPYAALNTTDLQSVKPIQKPDFISNPDKYFSGSAPSKKTGTKKLPALPAITDQLQMRYDEKSLFPKHILDMDAKMKTAHALTLRGKRGSKFKGGRVSAASSPNRLKGLLGDAVAQAEKTKKAPNWNKMLINRSSQAGTKIDDVIYEV